MKLVEAAALLKRRNVPAHLYTIGGLGSGDCLGIESVGDVWQVYYSERGQKSSIYEFDDEDEAVNHFLQEVEKDFTAWIDNRRLSRERLSLLVRFIRRLRRR